MMFLKAMPAIAAGCTGVHKPAELSPLSAQLAAALLDDAGLPPGVYNLVSGTGEVAGSAISAHRDVDLVSFTGSTAAGAHVAADAASTVKRSVLELGGKSACVVLDDADLDAAVPTALQSAFNNAGQMCGAWTRLVVPRALMAEVTEHRGFYVRPTVFADVDNAMKIAQEEIFGPVLAIIAHDGDDDAVAIANDCVYGLRGAVFSADHDRALAAARRMRTGEVDINGYKLTIHIPFGGYKQSGYGRCQGIYGFEEFLQVKSMGLPAGGACLRVAARQADRGRFASPRRSSVVEDSVRSEFV
jgi:aldehyde dehydrogenase (NAD+)